MSEPEPSVPEQGSESPKTNPASAVWSRLPVWGRIAVPIASVVIVAGIVAAVVVATSPTRLESAVADCEVDESVLGDNGNSAYLDMEGDELLSGVLDYFEVLCVLDAVDAPDYVLDHMGSTRSLDGRQSDEWDGIEASWSYHPDDGLDVLLVLK